MDNTVRIAEEAESLFMKYGVRAVTMDTIAHELGMSKRTIYEKFKDKDTLLEYVIKRKAAKQKEIFFRLMDKSDNVIEVIFRILETAFMQMRDTNPTYMMDLKRYHHKVYEKLAKRGVLRNSELSLAILRRGVKEGVFRDEINIDLVNEGIHGFIDSTHTGDTFHANKWSRMEILDNILFSYLRGICTDEGIRLLEKYRKQLGINQNGKNNE